MGISAGISIFLPVVLFIIFNKKYDGRAVPAFVGAGAFILFSLILQRIALGLFGINSQEAVKEMVKSSPAKYIIIVIFMAGIFEESARFISFKLLKNRYGGVNNALTYGVGHGGVESTIFVGLAMLNNIVLSLTINNSGLEIAGENFESLYDFYLKTAALQPFVFLISGIEQIFALTIQISFSVLVYYAAVQRKKWWLYPLAILLHAAINIPAALSQADILNNTFIIEGILLVCAVVIAVFAFFIHGKFKEPDIKNAVIPPLS
jgi:uncharacterized membrane protein YhfC